MFVNTVKAELRKFFTTRMWWGMAIGVAVPAVLFALLFAFTAGMATGGSAEDALGQPEVVRGVYSGGLSVAYLMTLAIGVLVIGSEYRHKTITSTFLTTPHRSAVMAAKVVALMIIGMFYGLISMASSVIAGGAVILSKGHSMIPDGSIWRTLAMGLLVLGLWALVGLGAGILIPNQVAALLIAIGVAWIVEPLLTALVLPLWEWGKTVSMYMPSAATQAMLSVTSTGFDGQPLRQLSWWGGALVLTAYAAVMAGVGTALTVRRDVT